MHTAGYRLRFLASARLPPATPKVARERMRADSPERMRAERMRIARTSWRRAYWDEFETAIAGEAEGVEAKAIALRLIGEIHASRHEVW